MCPLSVSMSIIADRAKNVKSYFFIFSKTFFARFFSARPIQYFPSAQFNSNTLAIGESEDTTRVLFSPVRAFFAMSNARMNS